jgi:uncharacterized membrane protein (DUF4010 family)
VTPSLLRPFLLTLGVSFLMGTGLRDYYEREKKFETFGTVRTFVFLGLLGFALFLTPVGGGGAFVGGLLAVAVLLSVYYANKLREKRGPGLIGVLIALLTYTIGPIALSQPAWFSLLIAVSTLFVLHSKGPIRHFTDRLHTGEVVTACKFIAIAGVVLPLMPEHLAPDAPLSGALSALPITPRQLWMAVVVTTSISYLGYVLHTYIVPERSLMLTGVLGGIYSSTATVLIVARRSKENPGQAVEAAGAIVMAVSMMYLRLLALVAVFRPWALVALAPVVYPLAAGSALHAWWLHARRRPSPADLSSSAAPIDDHPLQLRAAMGFASAFLLVSWATRLALEIFDEVGLRWMSFAVGFTDITPFVVSVLQSGLITSDRHLSQALIIATASNNLLKAAYTVATACPETARRAVPALLALVMLSGIWVVATSG